MRIVARESKTSLAVWHQFKSVLIVPHQLATVWLLVVSIGEASEAEPVLSTTVVEGSMVTMVARTDLLGVPTPTPTPQQSTSTSGTPGQPALHYS